MSYNVIILFLEKGEVFLMNQSWYTYISLHCYTTANPSSYYNCFFKKMIHLLLYNYNVNLIKAKNFMNITVNYYIKILYVCQPATRYYIVLESVACYYLAS